MEQKIREEIIKKLDKIIDNVEYVVLRDFDVHDMPITFASEVAKEAYNLGIEESCKLSRLKFIAGESGYLDKESENSLKLI